VVRRLLATLRPPNMPVLAEGVASKSSTGSKKKIAEPKPSASNLTELTLEDDESIPILPHDEVYQTFLALDGPRILVTTGPLTTLANAIAAIKSDIPEGLKLYTRGGAVWTAGDAAPHVESIFARDPAATKSVLESGLAITVAPLDVTNYITLDASHVAHLSASGYRTGELAARALEPVIESDAAPGYGKAHIAGAVTVAAAIWPDLFMRTRMRLEIDTTTKEPGRSKPALGGDKSKQIDLLTAVNAVDLLENLLEALCHEEFVV
jgi:inosine-uridine nucleoside N-ribohydrolase